MRWLSFILVGLVVAAGVRAESPDDEFLVGLRERRLYDLAEARGLRQWQRNDLSELQRAELAIQLALVYTDHALASPPDQRDALWAKADGICAALADGWPGNPRRPLVDAQRALVQLARGEQLRDEANGSAPESAGLARAAEYLRAAARGLTALAETTHRQLVDLRLRPPMRPAPDALSVDELESFEANLSYQLAQAQRQLGLCYRPGSADRDDALLQAFQRLQPVAQQVSADELVWNARVEALACLRELGRLTAAHERLAAWTRTDPPTDVAARLAAERVRLLVAEGRFEEALRAADDAIRATATPQATNGQLALARLEALLAARKHDRSTPAHASGGRPWEHEIADIGRLCGPYWQRRAALLVSRAVGSSAIGGDGDSLLAAANLYHDGKSEEAVAAYDRAAAALDQAGQTDQAVDAAMAAAAIVRQTGDVAQAAARYRNLAASHADHPRAPEAHRLVILCMADQMRNSTPDAEPQWPAAYEQLLREHLARWPAAATTNDVRWWLGQLLAARCDWSAARGVLESIPPSSEHFAAAAELAADCYRHELRVTDRQDTQRQGDLLDAATRFLQPIITGPDNRWPADWSNLQLATAVSLARLHLLYAEEPSDYAERLLAAAIGGAATLPDGQRWQQTARPLLVVVLARSGKVGEAQAALAPLASAPPPTVMEVLSQLDEQLARTPAGHRLALGRSPQATRLGELMLDAAGLLDARRGQLDAETAARLDRYRAAALAAVGARDAALAQYAALVAQRPNDGQIHEDYASLLAEGNSADELREALRRWQHVEQRSRRGGPRWIRARQARIELLDRLDERQEAEKLLRLTRLLYPDWDRRAP